MTAGWQQAVKEAMRTAAAAETAAGPEIGSTMVTPAFNYRWEHVTTVVKLALKLAKMVGADPEVVEAAAWLHDIAKAGGEEHAELGANYARAILHHTDFPPEKIERVAQAIADHKGLWRDEPLADLESMVLWDADKLSKIGLTAAAHWTGWALADGRAATTAELIDLSRADWQARTAASFHTEPARRAAAARLLAYRRFWADLQAELNGDDLDNN